VDLRGLLPVQALLHAPLLRDWYLGGGHSYALCTRRNGRPCLACELVRTLTSSFPCSLRRYSSITQTSIIQQSRPC
jgi:hypothetical protein